MPIPQIGEPAPGFTCAALLPDKSFAVSECSPSPTADLAAGSPGLGWATSYGACCPDLTTSYPAQLLCPTAD